MAILRWGLVAMAVLHAWLAAEYNAIGDGRLTLIFTAASVVAIVTAWFAKDE